MKKLNFKLTRCANSFKWELKKLGIELKVSIPFVYEI